MKRNKALLVFLMLFGLCMQWNTSSAASAAKKNSESEYFGVDLDAETKSGLQAKIAEIKSDKDKRTVFMEAARHRTVLCKTCHGEDGKAIKPLTPNLAGQNMDYLIDQMKRYQSKDRYDFWMSNLAVGFSDEDIIKIAILYSTKPEVTSADGDPALSKKGKEIFTKVCVECHGEDGKGKQGYARLAGQRSDYVVKMLKEFRDRTGRRSNPWMTAVSLRLKEADMMAVASYISHMQ